LGLRGSMVGYIVRRLLWFIPIVLLTLTALFFLFQVVPGDPIQAAYGGGLTLSPEQIANLRAELGLDQPVLVRYFSYLWNVFHFNLGVSFYTSSTVLEQLTTRIPVTLGLVLLAMIILITLSLPAGIVSGYFHDKWPDWIIRPFCILFISVPGFWIACLLITIMLVVWHFSVPLSYLTLFNNPIEALKQYIAPAAIMGLHGFAISARIVRSSMIEIMEEDYIRTARAKGLTETMVTLRHGLPNSLVPVVTFYGLQIVTLVGSTVIIETIFGMNGIGGLVAQAASNRDIYVLQGGIMVLVFVSLAVNLIVDLSYARLDPRVRY
jgi:peptide/nickel transport system permease protein